MRRSEVELSAARAHFGDAAVAEFAAALEAARGEMLRGFTLRQQLDDDIPEDEPTKRRMLAEIITVCRAADERLDAQVAAFDQLRNLEATAPEYLAGLATRLDATNGRLPVAEARWAALQKQYAPGSWEPAAGNLDQARSLLTGAAAELAEAREALAAAPDPPAAESAAPGRRRSAPPHPALPPPGPATDLPLSPGPPPRPPQATPLSPRLARGGPQRRPARPGRDRPHHRPPPPPTGPPRTAPRPPRPLGGLRVMARPGVQRRLTSVRVMARSRQPIRWRAKAGNGLGGARRSSRGGRPSRR